jgi:hypothetical protein
MMPSQIHTGAPQVRRHSGRAPPREDLCLACEELCTAKKKDVLRKKYEAAIANFAGAVREDRQLQRISRRQRDRNMSAYSAFQMKKK